MDWKDIFRGLNQIQALFTWLANRGVSRDAAQQLLDTAAAEDRDVTSDEVKALLDELQSELDDTAALIDGQDDG